MNRTTGAMESQIVTYIYLIFLFQIVSNSAVLTNISMTTFAVNQVRRITNFPQSSSLVCSLSIKELKLIVIKLVVNN